MHAISRIRAFRLLFGLLLLTLAPALCLGADVEGSKDSPLLKRYEGSFIVKYSMSEFDSTVIPLGPIAREDGSYKFTASRKEEGRTTRLLYLIPEGAVRWRSAQLRGELKGLGYEILFSGSGEDLGPTTASRDPYDRTGTTLSTVVRRPNSAVPFGPARKTRRGDVYVTVFTLENHFWGRDEAGKGARTYARVDIVETRRWRPGWWS